VNKTNDLDSPNDVNAPVDAAPPSSKRHAHAEYFDDAQGREDPGLSESRSEPGAGTSASHAPAPDLRPEEPSSEITEADKEG